MSTFQAYNILVTQVGTADFVMYDVFAVWWATSGKVKVTKIITEILSNPRTSRMAKSADISDARARYNYLTRGKKANTAVVQGRKGREAKQRLNRRGRRRRAGDISNLPKPESNSDWSSAIEELSAIRDGLIAGLSDAMIALIIAVAGGAILTGVLLDLYETIPDEVIRAIVGVPSSGGGWWRRRRKLAVKICHV